MNKLLLVGLMLISFPSFATKDVGNGGGVHVCGDGRIEVYDIYEGFTRYNLRATVNRTTVDEYLEKAVKKIRLNYPGVGFRVGKYVNYLRKEGHLLLRNGLNMRPIEDANILVTDVGCDYQQIANWDDRSENVLVKNELYRRLDTLNQAALYLHEAVYKVARTYYSDRNSDTSRRIVAEALSDEAQFTSLDEWSSISNDVVLVEPKPFFVELFKNPDNYDTPQMNVHLGDIDLYDESKQVKVKVEFDFSAAVIAKTTLEAEATKIFASIKALEEELKKSVFPRSKRAIADKIYKLQLDKSAVDNKIISIKWYLDSSRYYTEREFTFKQFGSWELNNLWTFDDSRVAEASMIKIRYKVFIEGREVFNRSLDLESQDRRVTFLTLQFTQNKK